jgi:hypothetical protein
MKEILTLVYLQRPGEVDIATIGGSDFAYNGETFGRGNNYLYATSLIRTHWSILCVRRTWRASSRA